MASREAAARSRILNASDEVACLVMKHTGFEYHRGVVADLATALDTSLDKNVPEIESSECRSQGRPLVALHQIIAT